MAPVRIEYVIDHLKVGGAQRHLLELFGAIDRERFAPQVCVAKGGGVLTPAVERLGIAVRTFELGNSLNEVRTLVNLARMARRLRRERVEIVHGYLYLGNVLGMLAGALARTPILIASKRSLDRYPRPSQLHATRLANHFAHRILCNAEAVRSFVLQEERPAPAKLAVIPNGISLSSSRPPRARIPGLPNGTRVIGTIGRLDWKKAHSDLLDAMRVVRASQGDAELVVIGDGPLRQQLEQRAAHLGIAEHVHFLGERRDARSLLSAFDVFVLSSVIEGMPNVLLEALAAERPVVATSVGGAPEIITHEETGLLVSASDPDALAGAILRLLAQPAEGARLARAGRVVAARRFSTDAMVTSFTALYEDLAAERGLPRMLSAPSVDCDDLPRRIAARR
jgi:glycosyltransferase involved in cell wall biosynthesis